MSLGTRGSKRRDLTLKSRMSYLNRIRIVISRNPIRAAARAKRKNSQMDLRALWALRTKYNIRNSPVWSLMISTSNILKSWFTLKLPISVNAARARVRARVLDQHLWRSPLPFMTGDPSTDQLTNYKRLSQGVKVSTWLASSPPRQFRRPRTPLVILSRSSAQGTPPCRSKNTIPPHPNSCRSSKMRIQSREHSSTNPSRSRRPKSSWGYSKMSSRGYRCTSKASRLGRRKRMTLNLPKSLKLMIASRDRSRRGQWTEKLS